MISSLITDASFTVEFPRLMNSVIRPGLIVLFSEEGTGTVVAVPHAEELYQVGNHCSDWEPDAFEVFEGSLNLCNEADTYIEEWPNDEEGHALGGLAACSGTCENCKDQVGQDAKDDMAVLADLLAILNGSSISVQHG